MRPPIRDSYRVADGLFAGEYPGAEDPQAAADRLGRFVAAGITTFVDLTHPADPLPPYDHLLEGQGRRLGHAIVDMGVPTVPQMTRILDDIDAAREAGEGVYVHCWAGLGRTGTAVGCWLVRHGLDEGDALATIRELRRQVLDSFMPSPQTTAQRAMVLGWKPGR